MIGGAGRNGSFVRREAERRNSSTAKMHSMEADTYRLSDQVRQLQSKLDRAALRRDLIVVMELQKKNPRVSGYQNGQVLYKQPAETPDGKTLSNYYRCFSQDIFL